MNPDSNIGGGRQPSSSSLHVGLRRQDSLMRFMTAILEDPNEDASGGGEQPSHPQPMGGSSEQEESPRHTPSHFGLDGDVCNQEEAFAGSVHPTPTGNQNEFGRSSITHEPMQIDRQRPLPPHTARQDSGSSSSSTGDNLCTDLSPDDFTKYLFNNSGYQSRLPQHQYNTNSTAAPPAPQAATAPSTSSSGYDFGASSQWLSLPGPPLPELPNREDRISVTTPTTTNWSTFGLHGATDKNGGPNSNVLRCDPIDNGRSARRSFSLDFTPKRPREEHVTIGVGDYYSELQASLAETAAAVQREEDAYLQAAGPAVDAGTRTNGISNNAGVEQLFHSSLPNLDPGHSSLPNLGAASPAIAGISGDREDIFHTSLPNLGEQHRTIGVRGGEDRDAKRRRMLLQSSRKVVSERALGSGPMYNEVRQASTSASNAPHPNSKTFASTSSNTGMGTTCTNTQPQPIHHAIMPKSNQLDNFSQGFNISTGNTAECNMSSGTTSNIFSANQQQIQANNDILNWGAAMQVQPTSSQQPASFLQQTNMAHDNAFQNLMTTGSLPTAMAYTTSLPPIQESPQFSQPSIGNNLTLTPEYIAQLLNQPQVQRHQQELLQNFLQAIPPPPVANTPTPAPVPTPVEPTAGPSISRHNPFAAGIPMVIGPNGIPPLQQLYLQQDLRDEQDQDQQAQHMLEQQRITTNTSPRGLPTPFTGQDLSPGIVKKKAISVAFDAIPLLPPTIPMTEELGSSMKASQDSQQNIHDWDKKMGLRRSHSKTMRASSRSRKQLQELQFIQEMFGHGNLVKKEERAKTA